MVEPSAELMLVLLVTFIRQHTETPLLFYRAPTAELAELTEQVARGADLCALNVEANSTKNFIQSLPEESTLAVLDLTQASDELIAWAEKLKKWITVVKIPSDSRCSSFSDLSELQQVNRRRLDLVKVFNSCYEFEQDVSESRLSSYKQSPWSQTDSKNMIHSFVVRHYDRNFRLIIFLDRTLNDDWPNHLGDKKCVASCAPDLSVDSDKGSETVRKWQAGCSRCMSCVKLRKVARKDEKEDIDRSVDRIVLFLTVHIVGVATSLMIFRSPALAATSVSALADEIILEAATLEPSVFALSLAGVNVFECSQRICLLLIFAGQTCRFLDSQSCGLDKKLAGLIERWPWTSSALLGALSLATLAALVVTTPSVESDRMLTGESGWQVRCSLMGLTAIGLAINIAHYAREMLVLEKKERGFVRRVCLRCFLVAGHYIACSILNKELSLPRTKINDASKLLTVLSMVNVLIYYLSPPSMAKDTNCTGKPTRRRQQPQLEHQTAV